MESSGLTGSPAPNSDDGLSPQNENDASVEMPTTSLADTSSPKEETILSNEASPVESITNESESVAKTPAATGRSEKQKEADEGAADILKRMRGLWETEFTDIPANKRPKPPAWAARAALYKSPKEREDYIQDLIRNTRNSLMSKTSGLNNAGLGNNSDILMGQLMTALETAVRVARQLKHTRKQRKVVNMNANANVNTNVNTNVNSYATENTDPFATPVEESLRSKRSTRRYNNKTKFGRSKGISPLPSKTRRSPSTYNEPPLSF